MKNHRKKPIRAFVPVSVMIVILIICILLVVAAPNFIHHSEICSPCPCSASLKQIDAAKQQWAIDNKIANSHTTEPTLDAVAATGLFGPSLYIKATPVARRTVR